MPYLRRMRTRAEYLRAEAERCRLQAKKAGSATAMFSYLELADDLLDQAKQAELDDAKPKSEDERPQT